MFSILLSFVGWLINCKLMIHFYTYKDPHQPRYTLIQNKVREHNKTLKSDKFRHQRQIIYTIITSKWHRRLPTFRCC